MEAAKQKKLETAGWCVGNVGDFLGMSEEDQQLFEIRSELVLAIRRHRTALNLSQKELASRLKTSQPRVAKMERGDADVSLDQLMRAFTAVGGKVILKSKKPSKKTAQTGLTLEVIISGGERKTIFLFPAQTANLEALPRHQREAVEEKKLTCSQGISPGSLMSTDRKYSVRMSGESDGRGPLLADRIRQAGIDLSMQGGRNMSEGIMTSLGWVGLAVGIVAVFVVLELCFRTLTDRFGTPQGDHPHRMKMHSPE